MKKGFSLIELLIVIAIIGLLATLMLPNFLSAQEKAKETAVKAVMLSMQNALENYAIDNGSYPAGSDMPIISLFNNLSSLGYIKKQPINPFTGKIYTTGDTAGKINYSYDSSKGEYLIIGYKRDGSSEILQISNI